MKRIGVEANQKQMARLRNGHSVRLKKGDGLILLVHPERFDIMSKSFNRGNARTVALTPEELRANKDVSPEAHKEVKAVDEFNKLSDLKPVATPAVVGGGFVSNVGGTRSRVKGLDLSKLGKETGQELNYMERAGRGNEVANRMAGDLSKLSILTGRDNELMPEKHSEHLGGRGLGSSVFYGRGTEKSSIGVGGNLLANGTRDLPPALRSQPYSSNFQFQFTLPPSYAKCSRGSG